jgi:hypothetical protein
MKSPVDSERSPIFVIGSGRSGTTLLRLMLSAHPRIYLTHEASFYSWEAAFPRRAPRRDFLAHYARSFSFRWLGMDPEAVFGGLPDPLPAADIRRAYTAIMREKAARYGKPRWGDKTPMHAFHLDKVFRDYPDARVVRIVRDPRGTVQSLMRMPWASGTVAVNARFCDVERSKVAPYADRILEVRLEDLLSEARPVMARVLDFVGEAWDDAVLDHTAHRADAHDMPPVPWFESAGRSLGRPETAWPDLAPAQVRLIEKRNRRTMEALGYPAAELPVEPSRLAVMGVELRETPDIVRFWAAAATLANRLRRDPVYDDPATDAVFRRLNPGAWSRYPGLVMPTPPPPRLLTAGDGAVTAAARPSPDPDKAPIFIVGNGRSGTTLLRLMLCAHPRIYIAHEATFYLWEWRLPNRMPRRKLIELYLESRVARWLGIDARKVLAQLPDPLPADRVRDAYAAIMREKAALYGRPRFGDKTPGHAWCLERIYRDFPDARVIRIVRDPRGNVESLCRMPFASASPLANALMLKDEHRKVAPYRDRMLTVRLEDLLSDGRTTMGKVLDFVGEPWDDRVLDHANHLPDHNDMPPHPWLESSAKERTAPAARWTSYSPALIRLIERVTRQRMADGGYAPATLEREPTGGEVMRERLHHLPETLRFLFAVARISLRLTKPHQYDTPETNALVQQLNPGSWARYPDLKGQILPEPPPRRALAAPLRGDEVGA